MAKGWGDLSDHNTAHHVVTHSKEEWVRAHVHTNTVEGVWSLLKRSIVGTYHQLSAKHLPAYLDEISFRFNKRENPWLFRDTVFRLLAEEPLRYSKLTAPTKACLTASGIAPGDPCIALLGVPARADPVRLDHASRSALDFECVL